MKNILLYSVLSIAFFSCTSPFTVLDSGKLTMISHRNVDSKTDYQLLRSYAGGNEKELRRSRSKSIEAAIDETIKQVPGGEFLKNVRIYTIRYKKDFYYAVQGDIYGIKISDSSYNGFAVGDLVFWNKSNNPNKPKPKAAKIVSIKNANTYLIQLEDNNKMVEASASSLYKK